MATLMVPTSVTVPGVVNAAGPPYSPNGRTFIFPGHASWTDTVVVYPKVRSRDITDAFRWWLMSHDITGAYVGQRAGKIPMSGTPGNPNTLVFRSGVGKYFMEYGLRVGSLGQQVSGGPNSWGIRSFCSRGPDYANGYDTIWPEAPDYWVEHMIWESESGDPADTEIGMDYNQPKERIEVRLPGVLHGATGANDLAKRTITGVTVPATASGALSLDAEGRPVDSAGDPVNIASLVGDEIRARMTQADWSRSGDWGGGWPFSGTVDPAFPGRVTNVVAGDFLQSPPKIFADRPYSRDWLYRAIKNVASGSSPTVFSTASKAYISSIDDSNPGGPLGIIFQISNSDTGLPYPTAGGARRVHRFYLDDQSSFPNNTTIVSISPPGHGINRTVVVSAAAFFDWGVAGPKAPVNRPAQLAEPRRQTVNVVLITNGSHNLTFRNLTFRGPNHPEANGQGVLVQNGGAFGAHESWNGIAFGACYSLLFEGCRICDSWSDALHFGNTATTDVTFRDTDTDWAGRHTIGMGGGVGIRFEGDCNLKRPKRWQIDNESLANARNVDWTFDGVMFKTVSNPGSGYGLCQIKPSTESTPAPAFLNGAVFTNGSRNVVFTNIASPGTGAFRYPINWEALGNADNALAVPLYTGPLSPAYLGQAISGPGIAPGSYIDRIQTDGYFYGYGLRLSKPTVAASTPGAQLVLGQGATIAGFHFNDCDTDRNLEIWFADSANTGDGDAWFRGSVKSLAQVQLEHPVGSAKPANAGWPPGGTVWTAADQIAEASKIRDLYFAPRPDGSYVPKWFEIRPIPGPGVKEPRVFCMFTNVFSKKRIFLIGVDIFAPATVPGVHGGLFVAGEPSTRTGTYWFRVSEGVPTWQRDFSMTNSRGQGSWSGAHWNSGKGGEPMIMLAHLFYEAVITGNSNPGIPNQQNGSAKEVAVGTTKMFDYPQNTAEWNAGKRAHPRNPPAPDLGAALALIGPPWAPTGTPVMTKQGWAPGTSAWTISGNFWNDMIDNQITTERSTWVHDLEAAETGGVSLSSAGNHAVSPAVQPKYAMTADDDLTLSVVVSAFNPTAAAPGSVTFGVVQYGFPDSRREYDADLNGLGVATVTIPGGTLPGGIYLVDARYGGAVSGSTGFAPGAFRSVLITVPGQVYPGWQFIQVNIGGAPPPTPTTTVISATPDPANPGRVVTITVTVTGSSPSGQISLRSDQGAILGSQVDNVLTVQRTFTLGTYLLDATFAGDPSNQPSAAERVTLEVVPRPPAALQVGTVPL